MKRYALFLVGVLFLIGCDDGGAIVTSVPLSAGVPATPTAKIAATAVTTAVAPTAYPAPASPAPTINPYPAPISDAAPLPTPPMPPVLWESAYAVFTSHSHNISLRYPPEWSVMALSGGVTLVRTGGSGAALRIRIGDAGDGPTVRSGVGAGELFPRESVTFLGYPLSSSALIHQRQTKAVLYNNAGRIVRDDSVFIITLESNWTDYNRIDIPTDVQIEVDRIIASIAWGETPAPLPAVPNQSDGDSYQPRISDDGRTITFLSAGSLTNSVIPILA